MPSHTQPWGGSVGREAWKGEEAARKKVGDEEVAVSCWEGRIARDSW